MGLGIRVFSNIKLQKQFTDEYTNKDYYENDECSDYIALYHNKYFPIHSGNHIDGAYSYDDIMRFHAGSYRGYNIWRNALAIMAGYESDDQVWILCRDYAKAQGEDSYAMPSNMPFIELINFSDCEGIIGSEVAKKLLNDFKTFDEKAKSTMHESDYCKYEEWTKAFEMASNNGAVLYL